MRTWIAVLAALVLSCSGKKIDEKESKPTDKLSALEALYAVKVARAGELANAKKGNWLDTKGCDGALYTGKYSCAHGIPPVDMTVAEYPDDQGRFSRRPLPNCWNAEDGDVGSATEWSRDMGLGLFRWGWCNKALEALERHAEYGEAHFWKMGSPIDDGRVLYTPNMIGMLYELIYALGGENNPQRKWPAAYPKGLTGYQAHLQVVSIQIRGELSEGFGQQLTATGSHNLLSINDTMYQRLKEHAHREPKCAYYQYMLGVYTGDMGKAVDLLLSEINECGYGRKDWGEKLRLQDWLATASPLIKRLKTMVKQ